MGHISSKDSVPSIVNVDEPYTSINGFAYAVIKPTPGEIVLEFILENSISKDINKKMGPGRYQMNIQINDFMLSSFQLKPKKI